MLDPAVLSVVLGGGLAALHGGLRALSHQLALQASTMQGFLLFALGGLLLRMMLVLLLLGLVVALVPVRVNLFVGVLVGLLVPLLVFEVWHMYRATSSVESKDQS
ncbi:hypothetical protein [Salisaeta longa]|uniref:hypothetical protein n=1 Tax=Salisaeta longa TaxID=503170 RepID=UPI0003B404D7|nr:hypothetical protein [Salisaeta longa]